MWKNNNTSIDNVNTQIADRWKYIEEFIDKAWFFGQHKEIDRSKIILGVFLALPSEVKNWMTQEMLAEYLDVWINTLTARRYSVEVWRIQKAACMQFLQCNSTTKVLDYIVSMATGETDFNPAPAQKLYLQFIEWRSEKIALESDSPITIVFGGWKSSFVNQSDEADEKKKSKTTPVKTTDTTKWSVKRKISRLVDTARWKKK